MFFIKQTLSGAHRKFSRGSSAGHEGHKKQEDKDEEIVYCSELYSNSFILNQLKEISAKDHITKLTFEDLIERNDPDLLKAVKDLLIETSHDDCPDKTLRGREIHHNQSLSSADGDGDAEVPVAKRNWQSINFIGCISTADDYKQYLDKKHQFQSGLSRLLAMQRRTLTLPIRFKTKLEIHSMLDLETILELLQEVARDDHIIKVKFGPVLHVHHDEPVEKTAQKFMTMIDASTMAWTGSPIHMFLRYGGEDLNVLNSSEIEVKKGRNRAALKPIRACAAALEELINHNKQ